MFDAPDKVKHDFYAAIRNGTHYHLNRIWKDYDRLRYYWMINCPPKRPVWSLSCKDLKNPEQPDIYIVEQPRTWDIRTTLYNQEPLIFSLDNVVMGSQELEDCKTILGYQFAMAIIQYFSQFEWETELIAPAWHFDGWNFRNQDTTIPVKVSFESWMGEFPRKNSPWNSDEERLVEAEYRAGCSIHLIAKKHGRERSGIESRLAQLRREDEES